MMDHRLRNRSGRVGESGARGHRLERPVRWGRKANTVEGMNRRTVGFGKGRGEVERHAPGEGARRLGIAPGTERPDGCLQGFPTLSGEPDDGACLFGAEIRRGSDLRQFIEIVVVTEAFSKTIEGTGRG